VSPKSDSRLILGLEQPAGCGQSVDIGGKGVNQGSLGKKNWGK